MAKYKIKHTTILHNHKTYAEGSTIELKDEEAKRLEDFVELIPNQEQQKQKTQTKKSESKADTKSETKTESAPKDGEVGGKTDGE